MELSGGRPTYSKIKYGGLPMNTLMVVKGTVMHNKMNLEGMLNKLNMNTFIKLLGRSLRDFSKDSYATVLLQWNGCS